jgi:hypothetical protein
VPKAELKLENIAKVERIAKVRIKNFSIKKKISLRIVLQKFA